MFFLQVVDNGGGVLIYITIIGTFAMLSLAAILVALVLHHRRKTLQFQTAVKILEQQKKELYLKASIKFQEEERHRIAADLHDDAGPLLATVRLYLNDNLVHQEKAQQLQSIFAAKQIIDEAIQLIRNISHTLMPPTLKNFGLESATNDLFQKINGSGVIKATARFHDYRERLSGEREMLAFRVIQELMNNIIKHSKSGFVHLTQNIGGDNMYLRLHHDGKGISQKEFDEYSFTSRGLGLKNVASRMSVLKGNIYFEIDKSQSYYKVTLEIPIKETD